MFDLFRLYFSLRHDVRFSPALYMLRMMKNNVKIDVTMFMIKEMHC
jgi:hypothetical protein